MEKEKKRYVKCPECNHYTRFEKKEAKPGWFFFGGPLLHAAKSPVSKRPPCNNCGHDKQNFTHVFLETEISDDGNEAAYFTPEGERIELEK